MLFFAWSSNVHKKHKTAVSSDEPWAPGTKAGSGSQEDALRHHSRAHKSLAPDKAPSGE